MTQHLDFAILGRYDRTRPVESMPEHLLYRHAVSSGNQSIELFWHGAKCRYSYSDFPPLTLEYSIDDTGLTQITGYMPGAGARP